MRNTGDYTPVVELTRGGIVECVHYGAVAVVNSYGELLYSRGDPYLVTFPRSSMKPFQVLPFVEHDGFDQFCFDDEELSLMCASHTGTDHHVEVLKRIHAKANLQESDLQCGFHWPSDRPTSNAMRARGEEPTPYRHNCSGKHSGMLAHSRLRGLPIENYLDPQHGVQQVIRQTMSEMSDVPEEDLVLGTDGCSAPVYALPLYNFALAVARLCDPASLEPKRAAACRKITSAMKSFPVMVAGPERFDTDFMTVMQGKAVSKGGAEGYQMLGFLPGALGNDSPGVGVAFKISDGDPDARARNRLSTALMNALGLAAEADAPAFTRYANTTLRNWRGIEIGEIRVVEEPRIREVKPS